jgi:hypothetical protein
MEELVYLFTVPTEVAEAAFFIWLVAAFAFTLQLIMSKCISVNLQASVYHQIN